MLLDIKIAGSWPLLKETTLQQQQLNSYNMLKKKRSHAPASNVDSVTNSEGTEKQNVSWLGSDHNRHSTAQGLRRTQQRWSPCKTQSGWEQHWICQHLSRSKQAHGAHGSEKVHVEGWPLEVNNFLFKRQNKPGNLSSADSAPVNCPFDFVLTREKEKALFTYKRSSILKGECYFWIRRRQNNSFTTTFKVSRCSTKMEKNNLKDW